MHRIGVGAESQRAGALLGVSVGRVQKIALAPDNVEEVQLTLAIERGTPVKADTLAVLKTQGLTGLAFVDLTGGSRDSPPLQAQNNEAYPVIKGGPSLINRLESAATVLLANLNRVSENLNALMDEDNRRAFKHSLADIETLSHTLAARSAMIDATLDVTARTMQNTARASDELPQLVLHMQHSADDFDRMSNQLSRAGTNASAAFTDQTLPQVQQLVTELRDLTVSLQRVSGELEQNPSLLLYGKPVAKRGPGE